MFFTHPNQFSPNFPNQPTLLHFKRLTPRLGDPPSGTSTGDSVESQQLRGRPLVDTGGKLDYCTPRSVIQRRKLGIHGLNCLFHFQQFFFRNGLPLQSGSLRTKVFVGVGRTLLRKIDTDSEPPAFLLPNLFVNPNQALVVLCSVPFGNELTAIRTESPPAVQDVGVPIEVPTVRCMNGVVYGGWCKDAMR